jgi:anaerobic selenocysteine-containing dehydrogenase
VQHQLAQLLGRGVDVLDAAHTHRVPGAARDDVHDGVGADAGARGAVSDGLAHPLGQLAARRGLQAVAEHPAHPPQVPEILGTADRKILAPQYLLDDLPRLAERLDRAPDELVLVSRRHLRSNNSWLHNVGPLMKGKDRCTLLMHDDDATKRDVTTGDLVTITSSGGRIEVPVEVTGAIMPGVVSMPHGWGHGKPGTRMSVANDSPGVNTNILSPPTFIDEPSGNGALNGIPVTVTPVAT